MSNHNMFLHFDVEGAEYGAPVLETMFTYTYAGTWHMIAQNWVDGSYGEANGITPCDTDHNEFPLQISWDGKNFMTPVNLDDNVVPGFYLHLDHGQDTTIYIRYKFWVATYYEDVPSWDDVWSNPIQINITPTQAALPEEWPEMSIMEYGEYVCHIEIPDVLNTCILYGGVSTPSNEAVEYLHYPRIRAWCEKYIKQEDGEWRQIQEVASSVPNIMHTFSFVELAKEAKITLTNTYLITYYFVLEDYNSDMDYWSEIEMKEYTILEKDIYAYDLYQHQGDQWVKLGNSNIGDEFYFKVYDKYTGELKWERIEEIVSNPNYNLHDTEFSFYVRTFPANIEEPDTTIEYKARYGMTWNQYLQNSDYNTTDHFILHVSDEGQAHPQDWWYYIRHSSGPDDRNGILYDGGTWVDPTDIIQPEYIYTKEAIE